MTPGVGRTSDSAWPDHPRRPPGGTALAAPGLIALPVVVWHYQVTADPVQLRHDPALRTRLATTDDLILTTRPIGPGVPAVEPRLAEWLPQVALPAILSNEGKLLRYPDRF